MLNQATKDKLKALGIDPDALTTALKDEKEVDFTVPDGKLYTDEQITQRDENIKKEGKKEWEAEGEKKGKELAAKAIKKKFGIESDTKDIDKVAEEIQAKSAGGDAALKAQVESLLSEKQGLLTKIEQTEKRAKEVEFDTKLIQLFPAGRGQDLTDQERLALLKMNVQFEQTESGVIAKKNGVILQDDATKAPLPLDKVIKSVFEERKWISAAGGGGRGGQDDPPGVTTGKPLTYSDAEKAWSKANPGKDITSPEFQSYLQTASKEAGFDFNK